MPNPEDYLREAQRGINQEQWDYASAMALAGILSFLIGGAKAIRVLGEPR